MINLFDHTGGKAAAPADGSAAQNQPQIPQGLNHALPAQTQALLSAASMSQSLGPLAAAQFGALLPQMAALQQAAAPAVAPPSMAEQMVALLGSGGLAAAHLQQQLALQPEAAAVQHFLASAMAASQQQQSPAVASSPPQVSNEDGESGKASKSTGKTKRVPPKKRSPTAKATASTTAASKPAKKKKASPPPAADEGGDLDPDMSNWSVEQLEQHVAVLEQLNRPVPYTLKLLVGNAKRKEEKKQAKRIANRKFAHISRTRKKAFVQEITQQNDLLKRQAKILSLLPDVVLVIGANGDITFCSDRAERVLRYDMEELNGVNISNILSPPSKEKMDSLIQKLLVTESLAPEASAEVKEEEADKANEVPDDKKAAVEEVKEPIISQSSANEGEKDKVKLPPVPAGKDGFPLSVVKVTSKTAAEGKKSSEAGAIEDSGYSSLSTNDSPTNNNETATSVGRRQPVAPTCNICLLRKDRKEIWCEATLTVIANIPESEPLEKKGSAAKSISAKSKQSSKQTQMTTAIEGGAEAQKELLLSIRPFRTSKKRSKTSRSRSQKQKNRHQKRRAVRAEAHEGASSSNKRARQQENVVTSEDTEGPEREQTVSPDSEASEASKAHEDVAKSLLLMHERCSSDSSN